MKTLFTILFCLFSVNLYAQEIYPKNCVPWPVKEAQPIYTAAQPVILMLHNLSDHDLWITQPPSDRGVQAGFSSLLQSGKWSALILSQGNEKQTLKCIESQPGHEQEISCANVLAICQWLKAKLPEQTSGIFWGGENMNLAPLQAYLARQGYILNETSRVNSE